VHLTAKFYRPTFSRSVVIVLTNKQTDKQTDAAEDIHLAPLYATPMGKKHLHARGYRHILYLRVLLVVAYHSSFTMKLTSIVYETTSKLVKVVLNVLFTVSARYVPQ